MKPTTFLYISIIFAALTGCQARFSDMNNKERPVSIPIEEKGNYFFPTWISKNIIVFTYESLGEHNYQDLIAPDLRFYNIKENNWGKIQIPPDNNCPYLIFDGLERLPNQQIGYINRCTPSGGGDETRTIQELDLATGRITTIMDSGPLGVAGQFSFAPDMSELIQEDMTGRFLSNMLFYRKGDTSTQIISNFTRAMYPDWSPLKREISFWGTENYSGGSPHDFTTLPEILGLSAYPWDLYISTPEGTNLVKVLTSVEDPMSIKWSPKENIIAFSGIIDGNPGVFQVDIVTFKVTRLWSKAGYFDWSPDGSKMIIVDAKKEKDGTIIEQNINIISLE